MSKNRQDVQDMAPEKAQELKTYLQGIAAIIYEETPPEELNTKDSNWENSAAKDAPAR